jgi:hypothetical protein
MSKLEVNTIEPQCGTTLTLGGSGDTVTLAAGASQSGFGRTGTVDWDTSNIKTSTFTAANGSGYFANTSGGAFNMNLPAGSAGAIVSVVDYTNTFQTHALTVVPNGSEKIGGIAASVSLKTEGQSVTFVYIDANEGWKNVQDSTSNVVGAAFITATGGTITTSGDYKIHTFTGPGTFCVSALSNVPTNNVGDYVVIAGGGGGGQANPMPYSAGGGGGAGGYRESVPSPAAWTGSPLANPGNARPISVQGYPITVHAGGAVNTSGGTSTFSDISSAGGGRGGYGPSDPTVPGVAGGSGGGGTYNSPPSPVPTCGGAGNTPPVSPPQGTAGGNANTSNGAGAGGGGATAAAGNIGSPASTAGGAGATSCITGSPVARAGGGGGGNDTPAKQGSGGAGGGGTGGSPSTTGNNATAGTANTGGGGGGSGNANPSTAGAGGSGVVIIRYKYQ